MSKYGLNIIWSEEDHGYIVTCPEFPGLSAFGETVEDAISEAKLAQELFVETYEQEGLPLPQPQLLGSYSGQFRLRIPPTLHHQLTKLAEIEGVSLNQLILMSLASRVGGEQVTKKFENWLEQMERRLVKRTVTNNMELAISLIKAWEGPSYTSIRETESNAPEVPSFVSTKESLDVM